MRSRSVASRLTTIATKVEAITVPVIHARVYAQRYALLHAQHIRTATHCSTYRQICSHRYVGVHALLYCVVYVPPLSRLRCRSSRSFRSHRFCFCIVQRIFYEGFAICADEGDRPYSPSYAPTL